MSFVAPAILIGVLVAGAAPAATLGPQEPKPDPKPALTSLTGTEWTVVELAGTPVTATPGPREPYLAFLANGKVGGADGCNRLSGTYTAKPPNGLAFGPVASTRMACPGGENVGARLASAMQGTSHWSLVAGRLELLGATGPPLAILAQRAPVPAKTPKEGAAPAAKVPGKPKAGKPVTP